MAISLYVVQPGDQLLAIVRRHYGPNAFASESAALLEAVMDNNPHISDPDLIFPGNVIALPAAAPQQKAVPLFAQAERTGASSICRKMETLRPETLSLLQVVNTENVLGAAGGGTLGFIEKASTRALEDVRSVGLAYYQSKAGTITRNQYNYRRRIALDRADARLGPLRQGFTPGKTARQAVRINPNAAIRAQSVLDDMTRLDRAAKLAKNGGLLLKAVDLGLTAADFHTAETNEERTVIAIDGVSSAVGGIAATTIAVVILGTPVGWMAIAGIAAVGAIGSIGGEALGRAVMNETLYDENGQRVSTSLDRFWRNFYDR